MKIWLLSRPGGGSYDEYDAWVVRSKDEESAWKLCKEDWGDAHPPRAEVVITQVTSNGPEEKILGSFNAG